MHQPYFIVISQNKRFFKDHFKPKKKQNRPKNSLNFKYIIVASSTLGILKISISQTFLMFRLIYHAILLPTVHPYRESTGWPQQWTS